MSAFGGLLITNRGRNLQAKAQTGTQLTFTRMGIGDGELGGSSIPDLNALKHEVLSLSLTELKVLTGGKARVRSILSNQEIVTGFYFREIGIFAQDPDLGEILYCYGNAGANAEYIPAGGGPDIIEKRMDVITLIGNAAAVSAVIDESLLFVTLDDFEAHINGTDPHPIYTTETEVINLVNLHKGESDPHSQYATDADLLAHLAETVQDAGVTYTVGPGCDFETIQAALDSLRKTRITSSATVTISVVAGVHSHTAQVTVTHPNGDRIQIIGADPITTTASAVGTITGGAGNYSTPITVASVTGIQVGQFAILRNTTGTGDHECLQGIWEITGIAGSVVTLKNTFRGAAFPAVTLTGGDFVVLTTTLKFTGCDGIVVDRAKLGLLNNVAVVGDSGHYGVYSATGASIIVGLNVGVTKWETGFLAINRAGITAPGTASCGNTSLGYFSYMMSGMSVGNSIASGNVGMGIRAGWGSAVAAQDAIACGNLTGIHTSNGSRGLADRAKTKRNKEQGIQSDYGSVMSAWGITSLQNGYLDIYCYEHSYLICRNYVGSPSFSPAVNTAGNNLSIIAG